MHYILFVVKKYIANLHYETIVGDIVILVKIFFYFQSEYHEKELLYYFTFQVF